MTAAKDGADNGKLEVVVQEALMPDGTVARFVRLEGGCAIMTFTLGEAADLLAMIEQAIDTAESLDTFND